MESRGCGFFTFLTTYAISPSPVSYPPQAMIVGKRICSAAGARCRCAPAELQIHSLGPAALEWYIVRARTPKSIHAQILKTHELSK